MHYYVLDQEAIKESAYITVPKNFDLFFRMIIEVDDENVVRREMAFNAEGSVVHIKPSSFYECGAYGIFDLVPVGVSTADQYLNRIEKSEFEKTYRQFSTGTGRT